MVAARFFIIKRQCALSIGHRHKTDTNSAYNPSTPESRQNYITNKAISINESFNYKNRAFIYINGSFNYKNKSSVYRFQGTQAHLLQRSHEELTQEMPATLKKGHPPYGRCP